MLSSGCALKRSPLVRATRKCVFHRAALRPPGVWNPGLHVLISLPPGMVVLSFPHHTGSGGGRVWLNGVSYGLLQLDKGSLLTAAVPASAIAAPGPDAVAVVNPAPGGRCLGHAELRGPARDPFLRTRLRANLRSPRCVLFGRLVWSLVQPSLSLSRSPALLR